MRHIKGLISFISIVIMVCAVSYIYHDGIVLALSDYASYTDGDSDFYIADGELISYMGSDDVVTVPSSVNVICQGAFYSLKKLKKIIIPNTVKTIDNYAVYQCKNLRVVKFTKSTTSIASNAIYGANSITNIVAPKNSAGYKYALKNDFPVTTSDKIKFRKSKLTLLKGYTRENPLYNALAAIKWKSSDKRVVSVSKTGTIKAKKIGRATIKATVSKKTYKYTVTVKKRTVNNAVSLAIKESVTSDMSKYAKIKAIHDWLVKNVKYDYYRLKKGKVPHVSHTVNGALVNGIAVCDGYAKAYKKILNKAGIGCKYVVGYSMGSGHAWNMVKTGGKWYHVDVTYDDPIVNGSNKNVKPYYTYFMKSSEYMRRDHVWYEANYPKCKSKKYD